MRVSDKDDLLGNPPGRKQPTGTLLDPVPTSECGRLGNRAKSPLGAVPPMTLGNMRELVRSALYGLLGRPA